MYVPKQYVTSGSDGLHVSHLALVLKTGTEGAWTMIQHLSDADRLGAIAGLEGEPQGQAVASVMRTLETARGR